MSFILYRREMFWRKKKKSEYVMVEASMVDGWTDIIDKYQELNKKYRRLQKEHNKLQVEHSRLLFDMDAVIEHEVEKKCKKLKNELVVDEFAYKELLKVKDFLKEENKKLKAKLEEVEKDLQHRDSFFSIMWDTLANEEISNEHLVAILYTVVHQECGDDDLSKKELEIVKKFWNRDYV